MSAASDDGDEVDAVVATSESAIVAELSAGAEPGGPTGGDGVADARVVVLREVVKSYASPAGPIRALDGVALDVESSGVSVVSGAAGSGVSTLLRLVACIDRADSGQVWVAGVDAATAGRAARRDLRRRSIGIVLPDPATNLLPGLAAGANIAWAAKRRTGAVLNATGIDAHLDMVGLGGATRRRIDDLTGGERQRLALACALVAEPRLVVTDDPTVTLDRDEATRFINALRDAADRGVSVIAGTTDPLVLGAADTVVRLVGGRLS